MPNASAFVIAARRVSLDDERIFEVMADPLGRHRCESAQHMNSITSHYIGRKHCCPTRDNAASERRPHYFVGTEAALLSHVAHGEHFPLQSWRQFHSTTSQIGRLESRALK
jgi:hypothetical protein